MSDIAALAPDLAAILGDGDAPSEEHDALPAELHGARAAAVADLRAEEARRAGSGHEGAARLLGQLADRLEQQRLADGVDRLVHELLGDLLADALAASETGREAYLATRAFALKAIARHAPLWPGAGPRLGCAYGYESMLAVVRLSAGAGAAAPA